MKLLGDWNWYLPRWLEWLPNLEHDETPKAPSAPVAIPRSRSLVPPTTRNGLGPPLRRRAELRPGSN